MNTFKLIKYWFEASLSRKTALAAFSISIILLITLGVGSFLYTRQLVLREIDNDLENEVSILSQRIEYIIKQILYENGNLAANPLIRNSLVDSEGRHTYLKPYIRNYRFLSDVDVLVILSDFNGEIIASNTRKNILPSTSFYKDIIDSGRKKSAILQFEGKYWLLLASAVIFPATGMPEGVLVFAVEIGKFFPEVRQDGKQLTVWRLFSDNGTEYFNNLGTSEKLIEKRQILSIDTSPEPLKLVLAVGKLRNQSLGHLEQLGYIYGIFGLVAIILITWLSVLFARRLTGPLISLSKAAVAVSDRGESGLNADIRGHDEVAALAHTLKDMLARLSDYNKNLERLVKDRTRELSAKEGYFRTVLNSALDGIVTLCSEGTVESLNASAETMLEADKDEYLGRPLNDLFECYIGVGEQNGVNECRNWLYQVSGKSFELNGIHKNGTVFPIEVSVSEMEIESKIKFVIVFRDITRRREAENTLLEVSRRLSLATSSGGIGVWDWDIRNNILTWDERMYELYGVKPQDFSNIYEGWRSRIIPDDLRETDEAMRRSLLDGDDYNSVFRIMKDDGSVAYIKAAGITVRDAQGNAWRMIGVNWDVSGERFAEEALRESEERFRRAFEISPNGMAILSVEGNWIQVNRRFCDMLGYSADEMLAKNYRDVVNLADYEKNYSFIREVIDKKAASCSFESGFVRRNSGIVSVLFSASPVFDPLENTAYLVAHIVDLTHYKQAENELLRAKDLAVEASRAKSEFLANMSHEIRTPLNAIIGLSQLSMSQELSPVLRDYLVKIHSSSKLLLGIINDILDYSKIEAGRLELEYTEFETVLIIEQLDILFSQPAQEKENRLFAVINPGVPRMLLGDSLRLVQILTNLMSNANKFTSKGRIELSIELVRQLDEGAWLRFDLKDTGVGITGEHLEKIFQPFSQADTSTTRRFGGTGLGLTISRRLAKMMGGTLEAMSEPGKGSTFSLTVFFGTVGLNEVFRERAEVELDNGRQLSSVGRSSRENGIFFGESGERIRGMQILLAEDNEINQMVAGEILEKAGARVTIAVNGLEAVRKIGTRPFDLVLMDLQMPEMDGFEATGLIRRDYPQLPIIAMTAAAMQQDKEKCIAAGMNDHLAKPIEPAKLIAVLTRWSKRKDMRPTEATEAVGASSASIPANAEEEGRKQIILKAGFDYERGLDTVLGNMDLYLKLLDRFRLDFSAAPAQLREFLNRKSLQEAYRLVHTVKGVAGNLGAVELYEIADSLGNGLKRGESPDEGMVDAFLECLDRALVNLGDMHHKPEYATELAEYDAKKTAELLRSLHGMAVKNEFVSPGMIGELRKSLGAMIKSGRIDELQSALDSFMFDEAVRCIESMASLLDVQI